MPLVHTMVFAIGAAMAAASGVLFGPLVGVNHAMGLDLILKAFIVVVVGGMGNLGGSILASIFISMLEAFASIWWSPAQAVIVSFAVLILTLPLGPRACLFRRRSEYATASRRVFFLPSGDRNGDASQPVGYWIGFGVVLDASPSRHSCCQSSGGACDGDPGSGTIGDVARHPDRLHGDGVIRPLGVLRAWMYGAAAASSRCDHRTSGWRLYGLVGAGVLAVFVAYFSTRLRRHLLLDYDARLLADLLRHHFHLDRGDG